MAFQYSTAILQPDPHIQLSSSLQPCKIPRPVKRQIMNTSFYMPRKSQIQKQRLPEIIIPERKAIQSRTPISKTKTLPYFKSLDTDQSSIPKIEPIVTDPLNLFASNSIITMKKVIHSSSKKIKLQGILRPAEKKSPSSALKIEITSCGDSLPIAAQIPESISNNILYAPMPKIASKSNSRRTFSPANSSAGSRSPSISDRKETNLDPFYYLNILKNINFTSFFTILEAIGETSCNAFPYYIRLIRSFSRVKPIEHKKLTKLAKGYFECTCYDNQRLVTIPFCESSVQPAKLPTTAEIKELVPNLLLIFITLQKAIYTDNLVVLNFEGVLGSFIADICIKPGILKVIKELSSYFRVVLVLKMQLEKAAQILKIFEQLEIKLSAVYMCSDSKIYSREANKLQDYSAIYSDFSIKSPVNQVLILSSHRHSDPIEQNEEFLCTKSGLTLKLNIERAPIPTIDHKEPPICVLFPNYQIKEPSNVLPKLLRQIIRLSKRDCSTVSFKSLLTPENYTIIATDSVHKVLFNIMGYDKNQFLKSLAQSTQRKSKHVAYCKLHRKHTTKYTENYYHNMFIINSN